MEKELCRIKSKKYNIRNTESGTVHSINPSEHNPGITVCGKDAYAFDTDQFFTYSATEAPVTCKTCLRVLGKGEKNTMIKEHRSYDNIAYRIKGKSGVVHAVTDESVMKFSGTTISFDTVCGLTRCDNSAHGGVYHKTEESITCKHCLKALGDEVSKTIAPLVLPPIKGPKQHIAIYEEKGDFYAFMGTTLFKVLKRLKENFDDGDLDAMLEEGELTFYEANKVDVQVEVETTKKVIGLSKC